MVRQNLGKAEQTNRKSGTSRDRARPHDYDPPSLYLPARNVRQPDGKTKLFLERWRLLSLKVLEFDRE